MITKEDIKNVANIAKLKFTEDQLQEFATEFDQIVDFFEKINQVDTSGIEPTYTVNEDDGIMKDKGESQTLSKEEVLQNAHYTQYGYFKILKVVE